MYTLSQKKGSTFSASIFLAATTLGGSFLWVPTVTGIAGFVPAILLTFLAWAYLTATALLYMEAILITPEGANVYTICTHLIGKFGAVIGSISFIIINLPFIVAFYVIGHEALTSLGSQLFGMTISLGAVCILFAVGGGILIFLGTYVSDRIVLLLFAASLITFVVVIATRNQEIKPQFLRENNWYFSFFALGSLLSLLAAGGILPTLATHVDRDPVKCRRMVVIGMTIPLVIVLIWQIIIIGTVPKGNLWIAYQTREPFALNLDVFKDRPITLLAFSFFLLFSILTSFIGLSLATLNFFADLFQMPPQKRLGWNRVWLCVGLFGISAILGYLLPSRALAAVTQFEGWSEVIFNGLLPIWLIIAARYTLKLQPPTMLFGGKVVITILAIATFFGLYLQGVRLIQ